MSLISELNVVDRAIREEAEKCDLGISLTSEALMPLRKKQAELKEELGRTDKWLYQWIYDVLPE